MGTMTGGCQCGRIRFEVEIDDPSAYLCHCTMCRRATGGVAAAFKSVPKRAVRWVGPEPDRYASSRIAQRGFCRSCGTPLSFDYPDSDSMDLTIGAFDEPGSFVPTSHCSGETVLRAWLDTGGLPETVPADHPATRDRWLREYGGMPD